MAKSCLVDYRGFITDIRDVGQEFEVYQGPDSPIRWVICDDDNVDNALYNGEFFLEISASSVTKCNVRLPMVQSKSSWT